MSAENGKTVRIFTIFLVLKVAQSFSILPTHIESDRKVIFKNTYKRDINLNFKYKLDLEILKALIETLDEDLRDKFSQLKEVNIPKEAKDLTEIIETKKQDISDRLELLKFDMNNINTPKACTYDYELLSSDEKLQLEVVDGLISSLRIDFEKLFADVDTFKSKSQELENFFDDLHKLASYLSYIQNGIVRYALVLEQLFLNKGLNLINIYSLKSDEEGCPQLDKLPHAQTKTQFCAESNDGIICALDLYTGFNPVYIQEYTGLAFNGCRIKNKLYQILGAQFVSVTCQDETLPLSCLLGTLSKCDMAIVNNQIEEIRLHCELEKFKAKYQLGFQSFFLVNVSEFEYAQVRSLIPTIPHELTLPLGVKGGTQKLQLTGLNIDASYGKEQQIEIPKLSYDSVFLCPSSKDLYENTLEEQLNIYFLSSINIIIIGTLTLVGISIRKLISCVKQLREGQFRDQNNREILNLLNILTRPYQGP